ncbi:MAG: thiamine-phosphate kinase [Myxococcota bacterium]
MSVVTTDALVDGVHFQSARWPPSAVGYKAMAVNLSDIASMGAKPRYALLALCVPPTTSLRWLDSAAGGMAQACEAAGVDLVGGNVSRARDLSFTVTLIGEVRESLLLRRIGARPGDLVWMSGTAGDSALGLSSMLGRPGRARRLSYLESRHCRPQPRVALGQALAARRATTTAIDVSDGLLADLGHLLEASGVGARIELSRLPLSSAYRRAVRGLDDPFEAALFGGEDYELLFTSPPARAPAIESAARAARTAVSPIGEIKEGPGLLLVREDGVEVEARARGFRHL